MYQDEIFQKALEDSRQENLKKLKKEVKTIEDLIENFLSQILECTSTISERDFNVCSV